MFSFTVFPSKLLYPFYSRSVVHNEVKVKQNFDRNALLEQHFDIPTNFVTNFDIAQHRYSCYATCAAETHFCRKNSTLNLVTVTLANRHIYPRFLTRIALTLFLAKYHECERVN